ncbi:general secretion pathway protein D [Mariprofundus micogutta]|uniref:General secretion pathway protein D n=1 Tax=Mariprofundus micogutta TaxID=1921010 RepID=A0A1L8CP69_9PROT|nr:pilus (MSHA type) biogenesis protein MshL [Mariprofundus micogutta]GAV20721.1 general secretion pathway protein D [Mariprofundus micogutta]
MISKCKQNRHGGVLQTGIFLLATTMLLSSCVTTERTETPAKQAKMSASNAKASMSRSVNLGLIDRIALPQRERILPASASEMLYSFQAKNMNVVDALALFAKANRLNIIADKDVTGSVTVSFQNLPFDQAMDSILGSLGHYWEQNGNLINVHYIESKLFTINYIRLVRSDSGSNQASVSSSSSNGTGGSASSGSGGQSSEFKLEHQDKVEFWDELEKQLSVMSSKAEGASIIVNRMSGTVQVTDKHSQVIQIGQFINHINQAIHRQIEIEVKIVEVNLNDDFSLGIDWSRVNPGDWGTNIIFSTANAVTAAAGGIPVLGQTFGATATHNGAQGDITSVITALKEQGDVQVVSQPKIRTLNNQSAMIKVGTDRTFFSKEVTTNSTAAGAIVLSTDKSQVITEGIVLAITPQISADNWVMLDISPVITSVASISEVRDNLGNVTSSAPNLDIRQSSSLVRVRDGQTIVLGGLIQDIESETNRKVPGLGDIPALGMAFSGKYTAKKKKELVIFMTPRVVDPTNAIKEAKL